LSGTNCNFIPLPEILKDHLLEKMQSPVLQLQPLSSKCKLIQELNDLKALLLMKIALFFTTEMPLLPIYESLVAD
jgi:hypothetical protein